MAQPPRKKIESHEQVSGCTNCIGLKAAFEALQASGQAELNYLRQMVKDLTDKLMCLTSEAADRHHRLKLTELAQTRPEVMNGVLPLDQTIRSEEEEFDQWIDQFNTGVKR